MRCSVCFLECTPEDSIPCEFCGQFFHFQCTTWKVLQEDHVFNKRWRCKFCKNGTLRKTLFLNNYSCQDIKIVLDFKLKEKWSVYRFCRKATDCRRALALSKSCSDASLKVTKGVGTPGHPFRTTASYFWPMNAYA